MSKTKGLRPGKIVDVSGQYENRQTGKEVTLVKKEPAPPTPGKGQVYDLVDKTKH